MSETVDAEKTEAGQAGRILLGLLLGAVTGVACHALFAPSPVLELVVEKITQPVGQIWLRALIMIVLPLVFASLTLGVAGLGDIRKLGRIGLKTVAYFLATTALAATIGLTLVNLLHPGAGLTEETRKELMARFSGQAQQLAQTTGTVKVGVELLVNIVPRNPVAAAAQFDMLAVIFFSLLFGAALGILPAERARPMIGVLEALGDIVVVIIGWVMKLAPIGVFALIFSVTALFGYDILRKLLWYVLTVLLGLAIHFFGVYSFLVRVLGGMSPLAFFSRIRTIIVTAFSTSSSNATLPTTLQVTEKKLGVPKEICGFVLPLGATMNMHGTALFEGVTVLFIAQVLGVALSFEQQVIVVLMAVLMAVGTAGVPSGSIPLLMIVLGTVGLPPEAIALVLGVDRILDMCRTTLNVTGDVTAALYIARSEGFPLKPQAES
ncbi:MAG TPA: dicarboxylate/amino acid:cation symporter [Candidatus Acidoferrales bacterium]|nr:dicarboxylate/amino acid:cation symporter [Candidatus Acidoferrales bacterium]